MALERLDREVEDFVARNLRQLLINVLVKFILIATAFIFFELGWISAPLFAIIAGCLLGLFLIRDIWRIAPPARAAFTHLRTNGWKPKTAITNYVSTMVFDQALQEVTLQTADRKTKTILRLAGTSHDEISLEIAQAVAHIARDVSFDKIRPRIAMAIVRAAVIMALYSAIMVLIFSLV